MTGAGFEEDFVEEAVEGVGVEFGEFGVGLVGSGIDLIVDGFD